MPGRHRSVTSFSKGRRCFRVPRHSVTDGVSLGADFQDFEGAAGVIMCNAWHDTFLTERFQVVVL